MAGRMAQALQGPGWYADPGDIRQVRYWDGRAWTGHTAMAPSGAGPPPAPPPRPGSAGTRTPPAPPGAGPPAGAPGPGSSPFYRRTGFIVAAAVLAVGGSLGVAAAVGSHGGGGPVRPTVTTELPTVPPTVRETEPSTVPEPSIVPEPSTAPEPSTRTEPSTGTSAGPVEFTEYAFISTWYTPAEADDSAWVHFKAVDESGQTVAEVTGSDLLDFAAEVDAMAVTPERTELVDELRQVMVDEGWTELYVDGDWYQYVYGR